MRPSARRAQDPDDSEEGLGFFRAFGRTFSAATFHPRLGAAGKQPTLPIPSPVVKDAENASEMDIIEIPEKQEKRKLRITDLLQVFTICLVFVLIIFVALFISNDASNETPATGLCNNNQLNGNQIQQIRTMMATIGTGTSEDETLSYSDLFIPVLPTEAFNESSVSVAEEGFSAFEIARSFMEEIEPDAFLNPFPGSETEDFFRVTSLNFGFNSLRSLPESLFSVEQFPNLISLNFEDNQLQRFDQSIIADDHLYQELILNTNPDLVFIPSDQLVAQLETLDLIDTNVEETIELFSKLAKNY
eukprot:snap_masked-scaffold_10-processed-gene-13.30-mRNA-1 protein AED:1.00 eAED:1.00 QI:0/0/0/0/1/1/2/0/302